MSGMEIREITAELLAIWGQRCEWEHALPVVMVADGQDANEGSLVVFMPRQVTRDVAIMFLRTAADLMEAAPDRN